MRDPELNTFMFEEGMSFTRKGGNKKGYKYGEEVLSLVQEEVFQFCRKEMKRGFLIDERRLESLDVKIMEKRLLSKSKQLENERGAQKIPTKSFTSISIVNSVIQANSIDFRNETSEELFE